MARPVKDFDKKQFEALCELQCTKFEICDWFDTTDKTLENWCIRTYGAGFSEVFRQKRGKGMIALRRKQREVALSGNTTMLIWLGKQWLGQKETVEVESPADDALMQFLSRIDDEARRFKQETD